MRDTSDSFPAEGELDLDATLERPRPHQPEDIRLLRREPREADVVAILDMSLSMTGDKIALTALATAILHLTLDGVAVVSFDTVAHRLVGNREELGLRELIRRVLTVPAQGYTNLEAGLLEPDSFAQYEAWMARNMVFVMDCRPAASRPSAAESTPSS
jgi:uncharacterized protein with von Willebrand factor type A (vWA) domain